MVDLFALLFRATVRSEDSTRYTLATGEALACLNYLLRRGEISVSLDGHGVAWYQRL
ncbi:hypothetical protein D3C76_1880640 [compost metagenome]